jgi:hypothetical protein
MGNAFYDSSLWSISWLCATIRPRCAFDAFRAWSSPLRFSPLGTFCLPSVSSHTITSAITMVESMDVAKPVIAALLMRRRALRR